MLWSYCTKANLRVTEKIYLLQLKWLVQKIAKNILNMLILIYFIQTGGHERLYSSEQVFPKDAVTARAACSSSTLNVLHQATAPRQLAGRQFILFAGERIFASA